MTSYQKIEPVPFRPISLGRMVHESPIPAPADVDHTYIFQGCLFPRSHFSQHVSQHIESTSVLPNTGVTIMKVTLSAAVSAVCALGAYASFVPPTTHEQTVIGGEASEFSLIETQPNVVQWVTDDEKWALKRKGVKFMDVTADHDERRAFHSAASTKKVIYPSSPEYNSTIRPMLEHLNKINMRRHLETFTAFHTRYYKSTYGRESSEWLFGKVNETIANSSAVDHGATVQSFKHPWGQNSVIAHIPGRSNKTIVIGAHQDSINLFFPSLFAAPGADDDGSGTVTILEALRVLLQTEVGKGKARNTMEFHWYSAEEGGLLGSQAVFSEYKRTNRDVRAMLHQDMTGYIHNTLAAGKPESMGVITDFVDDRLTEFIKHIITEVSSVIIDLRRRALIASSTVTSRM